MSKYQPLSDRLSGHEGPEWDASFAEIEEVLGFPLPKGARTGRAWWADADKAHARSWSQHGFAAHPDPAQARVTFRRAPGEPSQFEGAVAAFAPSPAAEPRPPMTSSAVAAADSVEAGTARASSGSLLGPAALVAAGLALVAGVGALLMKSVGRRA